MVYRGKVRDTYDLVDGFMLMVATDRISAFDVVLPTGIPNKGLVLSNISSFWFHKTEHIVPNHFVNLAGENVELDQLKDSSLLSSLSADLARRSMIVKRAQRIDVECIVRGYIAGTAWQEYTRQGTVSGKSMSKGLLEGSQFPEPIFTPTTKAQEGHDENMSYQEVVDMVGSSMAALLHKKSLEVYQYAHEYSLERGIILADTKMEFGLLDGKLILIDELLTPDSSRFWDTSGYRVGASQPNFDKQFVRDWLIQSGWNREPPAPSLPSEIVQKTMDRYLEAYLRLTGDHLQLEGK